MMQGTEFLQIVGSCRKTGDESEKLSTLFNSIMFLQEHIRNSLKYTQSHQSISREHKQFNGKAMGFSLVCLKAHFKPISIIYYFCSTRLHHFHPCALEWELVIPTFANLQHKSYGYLLPHSNKTETQETLPKQHLGIWH